MGIDLKRIIYIFVFALFGNIGFAQIEADYLEQVIDGVRYYLHTVEQGHTLYSISKKYKVPINEILNENPDAINGISIEQELLIPVDKVIDEVRLPEAKTVGNHTIHIVQPKETFYGLSKKYNVTAKDIIDYNPEAADGLKIGMELKIPSQITANVPVKESIPKPTTKSSYSDSIASFSTKDIQQLIKNNALKQINVSFDSLLLRKRNMVKKDKEYNIAIMLPLYLDLNDTIEVKQRDFEANKIYYKSEIALRFYEGALMAIDALKEKGLRAKLYTYDTANDTTAVKEILRNKELVTMDLIIGPFFPDNFAMVATYAKLLDIPIVCPVPCSNKILLGNENVSKVSTSSSVQVQHLSKYIRSTFDTLNLIVINENSEDGERYANIIYRTIKDAQDSINKTITAAHYLYYSVLHKDTLNMYLDDSLNNVIIVPSNNHGFVSDLITKLSSIKNERTITLFGLEKWTNFDNIDMDYLHDLNVHIANSQYIDYNNAAIKKFEQHFFENYDALPTKYGVLGFEITDYYLSALNMFGRNFQQKLPEHKMNGLSTSFNFFKTGLESGYENQFTRVLNYQNFELRPVD